MDSQYVEQLGVLGKGIELEAIAINIDREELAAVGREGNLEARGCVSGPCSDRDVKNKRTRNFQCVLQE